MDDKKLKSKKRDGKEKVVVDEPKEEAVDLATRIAELEDQMKRSVADYRNLENRNREEKLEFNFTLERMCSMQT